MFVVGEFLGDQCKLVPIQIPKNKGITRSSYKVTVGDHKANEQNLLWTEMRLNLAVSSLRDHIPNWDHYSRQVKGKSHSGSI